jgi:hypothetical protein
MYRAPSPSRRVQDGIVYSSLSRAPRFKDEKQDVPGPGKYGTVASDFAPVTVLRQSSSTDDAHTHDAAGAPMLSRGALSRGRVIKPAVRVTGTAQEKAAHERATAAARLRSGDGSGGGGGGGGGGAAAPPAEAAAALFASQFGAPPAESGAAGAAALRALEDAVRRERSLEEAVRREKREVASLKSALGAARLEAQSALSALQNDLERERGAAERARTAAAAAAGRASAWSGSLDAALRVVGGLTAALQGAAAPDAYGRTPDAVVAALMAAHQADAELRALRASHESVDAHAGGGGGSGGGSGGGAPREFKALNTLALFSQKRDNVGDLNTAAPAPGQVMAGSRDLVALVVAKQAAAAAREAPSPLPGRARARPLTGAAAAATPPVKAAFSREDVASFARGARLAGAAGGAAGGSPPRTTSPAGGGGSGRGSAVAGAALGDARAPLRRLYDHYCLLAPRASEFYGGAPRAGALRSAQLLELCRDGGVLDARVPAVAVELAFNRALVLGGDAARGGLSFEEFEAVANDLAVRKYPHKGAGGGRAGSPAARTGLASSPEAFAALLNECLLPLEARLGRAAGPVSPGALPLPHRLSILPQTELDDLMGDFSESFLVDDVLKFFDAHTVRAGQLLRGVEREKAPRRALPPCPLPHTVTHPHTHHTHTHTLSLALTHTAPADTPHRRL